MVQAGLFQGAYGQRFRIQPHAFLDELRVLCKLRLVHLVALACHHQHGATRGTDAFHRLHVNGGPAVADIYQVDKPPQVLALFHVLADKVAHLVPFLDADFGEAHSW